MKIDIDNEGQWIDFEKLELLVISATRVWR